MKRSNEDAAGSAKPPKKSKFLDDSEDDETGFKINEDFAKRFEHNNKRKELQQLEDKYGKGRVKFQEAGSGDSESSSDEEEDDDGEFATIDVDAEINDTLNAIRNKDPRVYDKTVSFYKEFEVEPTSGEAIVKEKSMTLKDYHRQNLLAAVAGEDGEDEPRTYIQEQADIKNELVKALHDAADEAVESDEEEDEDGFLKAKEKPAAAAKQVLPDPTTADKDPENYLSNFFAARAWVPKGDSRFAHLESDDDEEDLRADAFEEAYNLRFEDPEVSNQKLVSHSRDAIAQMSVRRDEKKSARKRAREREQEKKEAEKAEREAEKARLRKLKIEQMEDKLEKIRYATGSKDVDIADWAGVLEEDWDNSRFDEEMQKRFGDAYYEEHEEGLSEDEQETTENGKKKKKKAELKKPKWDDDIDINDLVPDFVEDEEVSLSDEDEPTTKSIKQQKADKKASSRRDRRIIESLVDQSLALTSNLPKEKNDGPRFAYRETSPTTFGLSALDILAADDAQLNQWAGIKKLAAFRDQSKKEKDKKRLSKKGRLREWRKETFGDKEGPKLDDWYMEGTGAGAAPVENGKDADGETGIDIKEGTRKKRKRGKKKAAA